MQTSFTPEQVRHIHASHHINVGGRRTHLADQIFDRPDPESPKKFRCLLVLLGLEIEVDCQERQ